MYIYITLRAGPHAISCDVENSDIYLADLVFILPIWFVSFYVCDFERLDNVLLTKMFNYFTCHFSPIHVNWPK